LGQRPQPSRKNRLASLVISISLSEADCYKLKNRTLHERLRNIANGADIEFVELAVKVIAHKAATEMHVHHIL
jgi:hypothetical protein